MLGRLTMYPVTCVLHASVHIFFRHHKHIINLTLTFFLADELYTPAGGGAMENDLIWNPLMFELGPDSQGHLLRLL